MAQQRHWVAVVPQDQYQAQRLYAYDSIDVPLGTSGGKDRPQPGERVALVAATVPPLLFGLGEVAQPTEVVGGAITIAYRSRLLDKPRPWPETIPGPGLSPVGADEFGRLIGRAGQCGEAAGVGPGERARWLVSVALPIEAASPGEAVREFWSYVRTLGPAELPAFVWPRGDELAMQAFVLGEPTDLDPERDDG